MHKTLLPLAVVVVCSGFFLPVLAEEKTSPPEFSGRYPHLGVFNHGGECGIGAVVPWADRLWLVTYSPHSPRGSNDKLYEIDADLNIKARPESIGGTPANRLIHPESKQLFIGPYVIDVLRNVRVIPYSKATGRPTATIRHLTDPANKVYTFTMEEGLYEIDVHTLDVTTIHKDGHVKGFVDYLPGYHGKGGYSGQGRVVVSNNGERGGKHTAFYETSGCLAEWDGKTWNVVERHQFTEVTGPNGIRGYASKDDPIWASGWDKRSVMLKLLDGGRWHTFRLPIGDYSYMARHGWHTEWPRIREVLPWRDRRHGALLMNMHGLWWRFPGGFSAKSTGALEPIASYAKITGDFCHHDGRIVFGCDDVTKSTFLSPGHDPLNRLNGQSQSNLWFTTWDGLGKCGRPAGWGGPWVHDDVKANEPSDPYHFASRFPNQFAGYGHRVLHLAHETDADVTFTIEVDKDGTGKWTPHLPYTRRRNTGIPSLDGLEVGDSTQQGITVPAKGYAYHIFPDDVFVEWVRLRADRDCRDVTAYFHYGPGGGAVCEPEMFKSLVDSNPKSPRSVGLIRPRGEDLGTLHLAAWTVDNEGKVSETGYYEIGPDMKLRRADDPKSHDYLKTKAKIERPDFTVDEASIVVTEAGRRYRLPKGDAAFDRPTEFGWPRGIREVVTERSLLNAHGTFYVLPRLNAGGVAGIKPICTHNRRVVDFCSWRGMLVLTGTRTGAEPDGHYVKSDDGKTGLWFGDIDDLWKLGKPRGRGASWHNTPVKAGEPSDPYLMTGYDRKSAELSHNADGGVDFRLEVDFLRDGTWKPYKTIAVAKGKTVTHEFPPGYSAHWVRVVADKDCTATATFVYE